MTRAPAAPPLVELAAVSKDYRGLRPLRIERLEIRPGELVAVVGFDQIAAEVLVNLLTGAAVPDSGRVVAFGRNTADVRDAAEWLAFVDKFGIVSARAVLLEAMTALQNLAMPFTLDVEPLRDDVRGRAEALAAESGLPSPQWNQKAGTLDATAQMQIRFGRALALDPAILLVEHASAGLDSSGVAALGRSVRASAAKRGAAVLSIGVDEPFARAVAPRVLRWEPGTGRLLERRGWFGGRLG